MPCDQRFTPCHSERPEYVDTPYIRSGTCVVTFPPSLFLILMTLGVFQTHGFDSKHTYRAPVVNGHGGKKRWIQHPQS